MVVGLRRDSLLSRRGERGAASASPARIGRAARGEGRRQGRRHPTSGDVPLAAPFVRNAPARGGLRHQDDLGAARSPRCQYDDDLHARAQPGWAWRAESPRSARPASAPSLRQIGRGRRWSLPCYLDRPISPPARNTPGRSRCHRAQPKKLSQLGGHATLRPPEVYRTIKSERLMVRRNLSRSHEEQYVRSCIIRCFR